MYDLLAVRVVVNSHQDCYAVLGFPLRAERCQVRLKIYCMPKQSISISSYDLYWNRTVTTSANSYERMHEIAEFRDRGTLGYKEETAEQRYISEKLTGFRPNIDGK
ncbi:hypothetical protein CW304_05840 [Bacillus sp. UFRGS-B20]|nr:hypothetical protein CW304_05840 [Bacillus sp. UFRGS-B20]